MAYQPNIDFQFNVPFKVVGPAIIKVQAIGSAADLDVSAGYYGYLITN